MKKKSNPDQIFKPDEMDLNFIDPSWSTDDLLNKVGVFSLTSVADKLGFRPIKAKMAARKCWSEGKDSWETIGCRRVLNTWIVKFPKFADYYNRKLKPNFGTPASDWNANTLLKQKGIYLLTDVCELIPFTTYQLRYQAKKTANSKDRIGIWKDRNSNRFLVEMETFSHWIKDVWRTAV